jgi:type I restriction enzyme R subunit
MGRNEADTRATLIEPKLKSAGWSDTQITREYYYNRDYQYTPGRIVPTGGGIKRAKPRRVDYLLRISDSFPIAVVEAKAEDEPPEAGLEQAKRYAKDLGLFFAYSTNGHKIIEYDFFINSSRELDLFPSPRELIERWIVNSNLIDPSTKTLDKSVNPLLYPYCPESLCGKKPFYFQEIAIREVIKRIMYGRKRILLTMATGTGKTFVAFQIVWKLIKSNYLQRKHPDKPARVLFLADRIVLRDQAFNTFSPFSDGTNEPRFTIESHPPNLTKDLYFGIYQTLWSQDENGVRLFEKFPPDFFDLVIIDECHRSGFGTWKEILDHFGSAIHLGMTATPKQDENIDTYAYFCAEEPESYIDPERPELGTWKPPAFQYSLGRGIEDGFLATYKIHIVRTTVDKDGLRLQDAIEQGAIVFIPPDVQPREIYTTPQFEREITLPDRTQTMVQHLSLLLRRFGKMEKTIVFCVDMDHARLVARLLQDEFGPETGFDDYAVPIISEEGPEARRWLERFADSDSKTPVIATTAELLSTGVDVPPCKNIVFMKTISSPILFKQIIGRGSRIDPATDKYCFRIIDYTGATRLFDEWDRPPSPPSTPIQGPFTSALKVFVFNAETNEPIPNASVSISLAPNEQREPYRTDEKGYTYFDKLPAGNFKLTVSASGFIRRTVTIETIPDTTTEENIALKPERKSPSKIRVEGLEVNIADEAIFILESTGEQLTLYQYIDYSRRKIIQTAKDRETLKRIWIDRRQRHEFLNDLKKSDIHPQILAEVLGQQEADTFDLLCHLAFGDPIRTRSERATAFLNREQAFIQNHQQKAREVILELLEKYKIGGIDELEPDVFNVTPFRDWGGVVKISQWFNGLEKLQYSLNKMKELIYK